MLSESRGCAILKEVFESRGFRIAEEFPFREGDVVRIGEVEGRILRITRTGLVLETGAGQTLVPARRFHDEVSVHVTGSDPG